VAETSPVDIRQLADVTWVPVYTKPRCEKVAADYCRRHAIPCYLPLVRRAKRYQRRTVETFLPMFRSYLFAQLGAESRVQIVQSHKIVRVVDVTADQEAGLVRELNDILRLEQLQVEADLVVLPELQPGTPVVVTVGPFKGMTAIVARRRSLTRVTVNIELLGQAVTAEIDVGEIEPETE
jgi:transcription antitermination factor NusG